MNDNRHVDRYVCITNRERFLIVRALSLLENACNTLGIAYDEYGRTTPSMKEITALSRVFCEENWIREYHINHPNKVVSIQTIEQDDKEQERIPFRG